MKLLNSSHLNQRATRTFPGAVYYSPEQYALELERIWFREWLCAGRLEEIPRSGDFMVRQIADESLLFIRGNDGTVRGFYNACRHRGSRLCASKTGHFRSGSVICPYHGWRYSIDDGQLLTAPNFPDDLPGFDRKQYAMMAFPTKVWQGFIWFTLTDEDDGGPDFPDSLGYYEKYQLASLQMGKVLRYDVNANWKLIMENSVECYHCTTIHPQLSRATPPSNPWWWNEEAPEGTNLLDVGGMTLTDSYQRASLTGEAIRPPFSTINEADTRSVYYFSLLPHTLFGLAADYVFCFTLWPIDAQKTQVIAYWLADPDIIQQNAKALDDAIEFWDITNRQDWIAIELAQAGVKSRAFAGGGVIGLDDWLVAHFVEYVRTKVGAEK